MKTINQRELWDMAVPVAPATRHQAQIKQLLLTATPDLQIKTEGWRTFMTRKKFVFTGVAAALFIVASVSLSLFGGQSPKAYAEQSLQTFSSLSPNAQQGLDSRIGGDAMAALQAAESAKNLQVLTYDQVKDSLPHPVSISISGPNANLPGPQTGSFNNLKFLKYTDSDGATHIIGIDKNGMPAIVMAFQDKNGMHSGSVMVSGEASGQGGSGMTMSTNGPDGGSMPAGQPTNTACSQSVNGAVTCTTNGHASISPNCQTDTDGRVTCSASASSP